MKEAEMGKIAAGSLAFLAKRCSWWPHSWSLQVWGPSAIHWSCPLLSNGAVQCYPMELSVIVCLIVSVFCWTRCGGSEELILACADLVGSCGRRRYEHVCVCLCVLETSPARCSWAWGAATLGTTKGCTEPGGSEL